MCGVGALVERLVRVGEPVAPGVQPGQHLAALGSVTGQREGGEKVEACTGGLQVGLDLGVASPGTQLPAPDRLGERGLDGGAAQAGDDACGDPAGTESSAASAPASRSA